MTEDKTMPKRNSMLKSTQDGNRYSKGGFIEELQNGMEFKFDENFLIGDDDPKEQS